MKYITIKIKNKNINNDEDIIRLFNKFVKENYGQFAFVTPETLRKEYNKWYITVGVDSPYSEHKPNEMRVFSIFRKMDLFDIEMIEKGHYLVIKGLARKYAIDKFNQEVKNDDKQ
jgi:hypothetical protein